MKLRHLLIALLSVGALVFAGCTSESDSSEGSSDESSEESTETGEDGGSAEEGGDSDGEAAAAGDPVPMGTPIDLENTAELNLAEIAAGLSETQTLTRLVLQAGLLPTVRDGGPFTVFAPVEAAFAAVDPNTLLRLSQDQAQLVEVLTLHVVPGTLTLDDLKAANGTTLTTVQGGGLLVEVVGDEVTVGGAVVAVPDIPASNGIVHAVGSVITAPSS